MKYTLAEVCVGITDGSHNPPIGVEESNYLMISSKNVFDDSITLDDSRYLTEEQFIQENKRTNIVAGDVLMTIVGTVGRTAVVPEDFINITLQRSVAVLHPNHDICESRYLMYLLRSKKKFFESEAHGVAQKGIYLKQLANVIVEIPSISEQTTMLEKLDRVQKVIDLRKQEFQRLDELIKARFIELFGDPVINPKGFPCYTVGEVIDFQGGSQPDKKYFEYEASPDNIRLIQIRDYKSDKYITYIPKTMAKRFCTADDIMIGRYGPPIFQILKGIEGSFNVALMKATPKMGNREFVRQFLKQDCLLEYLEGLSKRTAGQDGIQMDKLKAYPFPYPPMELQEQFAAFVEQINKSKFIVYDR